MDVKAKNTISCFLNVFLRVLGGDWMINRLSLPQADEHGEQPIADQGGGGRGL